MAKKRILIFYAGYGEGHRQAAIALAQSFKKRSDLIDVDVVDYVKMVHPAVNAFTRFCYEKTVKIAPKLYGLFYHQTGKLQPGSRLHTKVSQFGVQKLYDYLLCTKPSAVINTFPLSAGAVSLLKEQNLVHPFSATVITDHDVHSQWVHRYTDRYYVGSKRVKNLLQSYGVSRNRIEVTGIPVREQFHKRYDRRYYQQLLGFNHRPTALVIGGWHTVFDTSLCQKLVNENGHVQFIFVCGRDCHSYQKLLPLQIHFPDRVKVFSFVNNMPELMAASDLVLTKAGGLTTSEALAMGRPMLLYRPIPGQEEENVHYLVGEGVATLARDEHELLHIFSALCTDRDRLLKMKQQAERIKPVDVSHTIAESILRQLERFPFDSIGPLRRHVPYVSVPFEG